MISCSPSPSMSYFNSTKVQLELCIVFFGTLGKAYFNSTKVQLELSFVGMWEGLIAISIPLRYN